MRYPAIALVSFLIFSTFNVAAQDSSPVQVDRAATDAAKRTARTSPAASSENAAPVARVAPSPSSASEGSVFTSSEVIPVAKWNGGELTNREVSATLAIRRPANIRITGPEHFATLGRSQQVETVKQLVYERVLYQKAKEAGIDENHPEVAAKIQAQEEDILNRLYFAEIITPEIERLTEQVAQDYYQKNKHEMFTQPARDVARALHVSTYEMVTVEEGDTLQGLAESISGDSSAAERILSGNEPYYLRQTPTELQDRVLSSPLQAGEVVFVPFGDDRIASATAFAENLRREILAGKTIDELATSADDYVVSATPPLQISADLPYHDELIKAAERLKETSVTEVVRTASGLNILILQDRETTETIPYETVREYILQQIQSDGSHQREAVEKARERTLDQLWSKYNLQINTEAISRPNYLGSDPLSTSTIIVHTDGFEYNLAQYLSDLRLTGKDWSQLTRQERLDILQMAPSIVSFLAVTESKAQGLDKTEEYQETLDGIAISEIVAVYQKTKNPTANQVTTEDLRAYYNDNLDKYTSPAQVTIREITKRINLTLPPSQKAQAIEEATESLNEIRSRINTLDDFINLARRESESISTRSRGGLLGNVSDDFRGNAFKNQLKHLEPGQVSEPFMYGSEVMIVRMDSRIPPTVPPFESVRRQVTLDYGQTMPAVRREQERDRTLNEAGFELLF